MKRKIKLNGKFIQYDFCRKAVKRINLTVTPNAVRVSAPKRIRIKDIENFILKNEEFIIKNIDKYEKLKKNYPPPLAYKTGEHILNFGEHYELIVNQSKENAVKLIDKKIYLSVTDTENFELKQKTVDEWKKSVCTTAVTDICREFYPKFEPYGITFPKIKYRKMTSRWGSCRPTSGCVTFNTHLAEVPVKCIEYVVVHEFTHFLHPNHSKEFYNRLSYFLPDYKERESLLKSLEIEIIKR